MMEKKKAAPKAASSRDRTTGTDTRTASLAFGRRVWAQLGLFAVLAIATGLALLQEPRPDPFAPVPRATTERAWQWLRFPAEGNPHLRLPAIPVGLNGVYFLRDGRTGWIAGNSGYIARTDDGGRTWVRGRIETGPPATPARLSGPLLGPIISAAHAEEETKGTPGQRSQGVPPPEQKIEATKTEAQPTRTTVGAPSKSGQPGEQLKQDSLQKPGPKPAPLAEKSVDVFTASLSCVRFADKEHGIAVGANGIVLASDDGGHTWRQQKSGTRASLRSIAHDGRRWVAVGVNGAIVTSENGTDWQARTSGTPHPLASVAHDSRRWVAVGGNGTVLTSENGTDWQPRTSGTQARLTFVAHDGGRWVAVGDDGTVVTSDNGTDWQARTSNTQFLSVAHGGGRWVAVGARGLIVTSENGTDWQARASDKRAFLSSVVHGAGRWVAVSEGGSVLTSENGREWQPQASGTKNELQSVGHGGGRWVAVGAGGTVVTSDNGTDWQSLTIDKQMLLSSVAHDGRRWVAVSGDGTIVTLENGSDWQRRASGMRNTLRSVAHGGGRWVAVGYYGAIVTSDNGADWQPRPIKTQPFLYSVTHDGRSWVVVGSGGTVLTSDNGTDWQPRTSGTQARLTSVAHDGKRWVAVGEGGTILISENGTNWQPRASGTQAGLTSVAYGGGRWVAVGHGVAVTSENGANWEAISYQRSVAGWYWLLCLGLLVAVPFARRIPEPELRAKAPERTVADQVVSDAPVRSAAEDKLRFGPRVDGLSRYLRNKNTEPPLTLAINGPWGSGKSSFMRMLQADLERHGARTVWFNAWHLQKEAQLQAGLLDAIRRQAPPPWWKPHGFEFRMRLFWKRTQAAPVVALVGAMLVAGSVTYLLRSPEGAAETQGARLLVAVQCVLAPPQDSREDKLVAVGEKLVQVLGYKGRPTGQVGDDAARSKREAANKDAKARCEDVLGGTPAHDWWRASWTSIFGGDLGKGLLILLVGLLPALKALTALRAFAVNPAALKATLGGLASRKALSEETSLQPRFTAEFATVTDALAPRILTIFIDDLDRCNEKQLMETLEAVNYLAESGRCYVILGMVEETVQRLVGLAVERLAAELAEQEQQEKSAASGAQLPASEAQLEEAKRERRRRFAERYLEKLINIKLDVPSLSPQQASNLMREEKAAAGDAQWRVPWWVGGLDWVIVRAKFVWLPVLLLAAAALSIHVASELAEDSARQQTPAKTAQKAEVAQARPDVPAPPPGVPKVAPEERERITISLPDRVAPAAPAAGWMQWGGIAIPTAVLLLAFYFALSRRLEYNTQDSAAFNQALEIWTPLLLTRLKTPRALKRFQNRLRFRAMALDAQASPRLRVPDDLGPLGKLLADRAQARIEAGQRFNELLPEPYLVGLESLRAVLPETAAERLVTAAELDSALREMRKSQSAVVAELDRALAAYQKQIDQGKWPDEYRWPPQDEHFEHYSDSLDFATRAADIAADGVPPKSESPRAVRVAP